MSKVYSLHKCRIQKGCWYTLRTMYSNILYLSVFATIGQLIEASSDHWLQQVVSDDYLPRWKREITKKKLDDPNGCIKRCTEKETSLITNATTENTNWLISVGMDDAKEHAKENRDEKATQKHIQDLTIGNMGPLFNDLCDIAVATKQCLGLCPPSQSKDIALANHNAPALYCEPKKNWPNFKAYYDATQCNNKTLAKKECDSKCGPVHQVSTVTHLDVDNDTISYSTDSSSNTKAADEACRSLTCHIDCYTPILQEKCGAKASDVFQRFSRLEPRSALSIMKIIKVIEPEIQDCHIFYKN